MTADSHLRKRDMEGSCDKAFPHQKSSSLERKPSKITLKNCDKDPGSVALHNSYFLAQVLVGKDLVFFKRLATEV